MFTVFVLVLAVGGLSSLAVVTGRQSFPETEGRLTLDVLNGPVEVLRDSYGVPQIYADTAEDLFAAQGYVHAQDRFYEMDIRRHITAGRLSELFGAAQYETDAYIRTMGWRKVAEAELAGLSPSTRRYLDAYAAGVNAYLHSHSVGDLSLEYSVLGLTGLNYMPEDWTAVDSIAWLKAMAWDLGSNRSEETSRAVITNLVGAERAAELYPSYDGLGFDPIVAQGAISGKKFDPSAVAGANRSMPSGLSDDQLAEAQDALTRAAKADEAIPALVGDSALEAEVGSNSWVLSGNRTTTGGALLANDPHLMTSIPSIFAQVGLHCRTINSQCPFEVSGFSFSGMPGVIIGHNNKIAWGFTTSYPDVQDLFLEKVSGDSVLVGDKQVPLEVHTEEIKVKGEDQPRTLTIRKSKHGPLLSDVDAQLRGLGEADAKQDANGSDAEGYAVALSWVALTPSKTMDSLFALDTATNFEEFRSAVKLLSAPSQNLIYGDVEGNIGYQLPGAIPIRGKGDGRMPAPGWDPSYDWEKMIPYEELPYVYNPPSGYIVTANQPIISSHYQHLLGTSYSYGWRSQEIIDTIKATPKISPEASTAMFADDTIRFAEQLVPPLLKIKIDDAWIREGQQTLVGWDYSSPADSAPAAYFNVVMHNILKSTFRDELPEEQWPTGGDRWEAVLTELLAKPNDPWWDIAGTDRVEDRDDILLEAMTNARKEITSLMARETEEWQWGKLHRLTLRNQTLGSSGIAPVESLFNRGDYEVGGGPAVVLAMSYDDSVGYQVTNGPTMRMLVDLSDLDKSQWINQSGVSGHAFHRNYDDQTELWINNQLLPFAFSRKAVEAATTDRLDLLPGG